MMASCPFSNSMNSTRSPAALPKEALTLAGIVICPFDVIVAVTKVRSFPCKLLRYGKA